MNARAPGRRLAHVLATLAVAGLAIPSAALASTSGGGGLSGTGTTTTATSGTGTTTVATTTPATPVSTTYDGITLQTSSSALLSHGLHFTGTVPGAAGQTVEVEREGSATDGRWIVTATATVSATGTFSATWNASQVGRFAMRAVPAVAAPTAAVRAHAATTATTTPAAALTISVYRAERATIYGPGFYGRRTACGRRLTTSTLGVANRNLPCGTNVSILYDGRTLTVPVIDRGPYANGANWDLTTATAAALGIDGTEQVGTLSLGRAGATSTTTATTPTGTTPTTTVPGAQVLGPLG